MKGRRALPTVEALTGQKPRQRLSQTECFKHQRFGRLLLPNAQPTYFSRRGKIGVPFVAASCACLGTGKGQAERQSEKMLSSFVVRFFRLPPLPDTAAALRRPATLAPQAPLARLQRAFAAPRPAAFVAPCSLGAFLAAPVPPKRFSCLALFVGCSRAPLVLRPCLRVRPAVPLVVR